MSEVENVIHFIVLLLNFIACSAIAAHTVIPYVAVAYGVCAVIWLVAWLMKVEEISA